MRRRLALLVPIGKWLGHEVLGKDFGIRSPPEKHLSLTLTHGIRAVNEQPKGLYATAQRPFYILQKLFVLHYAV